jgi:hypothetical protein
MLVLMLVFSFETVIVIVSVRVVVELVVVIRESENDDDDDDDFVKEEVELWAVGEVGVLDAAYVSVTSVSELEEGFGDAAAAAIAELSAGDETLDYVSKIRREI